MSNNTTKAATTAVKATTTAVKATTTSVKGAKKRFNENGLLITLNKLSDKVQKDHDLDAENNFIFNEIQRKEYWKCREKIDELHDSLLKEGYEVEIIENLEIRDISKESRFMVKITDKNGTVVQFDMFDYRNVVLNYVKNETDMISAMLEKMSGIKPKDNERIAKKITLLLSYLINLKGEQTKVYEKLGWMELDGYKIFKYDTIYTDGKMRIIGKCISRDSQSIQPEEYSEEDRINWVETAIDFMRRSTTASLLVGAGLSGIFRQMLNYTKERNINLNLCGNPATGKTTATNFVLSIFGRPEALESSFSDTGNAIENTRGERAIIPLVIDDRMLRLEGKSERAKASELLMAIFREYEGKIRERMGKQYENSGTRMWSPVISSSVKSMMNTMFSNGIEDYGQYRRFIEIEVKEGDIFRDSTYAERINQVSTTCYGYGVEILMQYIFGENLQSENYWEDEIKEEFDDLNKAIKAELVIKEKVMAMKGLQSSSQRFALIALSYRIFWRALWANYGRKNTVFLAEDQDIEKDKSAEERTAVAMGTMETVTDVVADVKRGKATDIVTAKSKEKGTAVAVGTATDVITDIAVEKEEDTVIAKISDIDMTKGEGGENDEGQNMERKIIDLLINNLVEKMKLVKVNANIKKRIIDFVDRHESLFYKKDKKQWDGSGDFLGQITKKENEYEIMMKKASDIGWLFVSGKDLKDEDIVSYLTILQANNMKHEEKKVHEKLVGLIGEPLGEDFADFIQDKKGIETSDKTVGSVRMFVLSVNTKEYEADEEDVEDVNMEKAMEAKTDVEEDLK